MNGINMAIVAGNLGRDPEVRTTQNGTTIANLSIATKQVWRDKAGETQERTEWHRAVCFGKTAELAGKYLAKGMPVFIQGEITTRKWQDQSGQDRYTTEIRVDKLQFLSKPQMKQEEDYSQDPDDEPF